MKKEVASTGFVIPSEFSKYKYVVFVAKTTSQKYEFILYTISEQPKIEILINNKLWHIIGFENNIEDFKKFANLLHFTDGLTNVHIYHEGLLLHRHISYKVQNILECIQNALKVSHRTLYCSDIVLKSKEDLDKPTSFSIDLELQFSTENKFKHIKNARQTFPCHQISNYYFNPYIYETEDIKDAYVSYALKKDPFIVQHCPFFDANLYNCVFKDEVVTE